MPDSVVYFTLVLNIASMDLVKDASPVDNAQKYPEEILVQCPDGSEDPSVQKPQGGNFIEGEDEEGDQGESGG